jgi:amidohydrolase
VLTIGTIESGFRWNVIAESARLTGTIRTYNQRLREQMIERATAIMHGVCLAFAATATIEHSTSCPPLVNDAGVTAYVEEEARNMFGAGSMFAAPSMGADDMAVFLERRPGCYFWAGARNEPAGIAGRHHDPGFAIDERVIPLGMELGTRVIDRALSLKP